MFEYGISLSLSVKQKAQFYHQLAMVVRAGVPIDQALQPDMVSEWKAGKVGKLSEDVRSGQSLAVVLLRSEIVSDWEGKLITIGEQSGQLETVLDKLESFFVARSAQLKTLKSRLVYSLLLVLAVLIIPPLPRVASGELSTVMYLFQLGIKGLALWAIYSFFLKRGFEKARSGAFNPFLIFFQRFVSENHLLSLCYEVSYLDILSLCLKSGLSAAQALRLLKEGNDNKIIKKNHTLAIADIENLGTSLVDALFLNKILRNSQIRSFLYASEESGSLHSDLSHYVEKKKEEVDALIRHNIDRLTKFLYLASLLYAVTKIY